jgi:uncharacterized protein YjbI with pentapeptide repeats
VAGRQGDRGVGGGLATKIERRGLSTRWIIHGGASQQRFSLAPADGNELKVFFEHCRLESVDFSDIDFKSFYAAGCTFTRCDFSKAKFLQLEFGQPQVQRDWNRPIQPQDKRYPQTVYEECLFRWTRFDPDNTRFGNARFVRCTFDHAWLRKLFTRTAEFVGCRFVGKVIDCTFHGVITGDDIQRIGRSANDFRENDFRHADLIWTGFRGIDLSAQLLPESGSYAVLTDPLSRIELATRRAEETLSGELRDRVVHELKLLAQRIDGEHQFLIRKGQLGWQTPADVQELLWSYLANVQPPHGAIQT